MKAKHVFATLGLALTMGLGVTAGLAMQFKEVKEVKAAAGDVLSGYQLVGAALGVGWNAGANNDYRFTEQNDGSYKWTGEISVERFRVIPGDGSWTTKLNCDNIDTDNDCDDTFVAASTVTSDLDKNIWCKTAGTYTITLNSGKNKLSFVKEVTPAPVFSLIGSYSTYDWDNDEDFVVNEATTTATLNSVVLEKGNSVKIRKNHDWGTAYGWSHANGHINITDSLSRGEDCFGEGETNNLAVLHNGTYNFSLNYSTGVLTITGERAATDSTVAFQLFVSSNGGAFAPEAMALKEGSSTEYMITRDFLAGDKFYIQFGSSYYHYSDFKDNEGTIKGKQFIESSGNVLALYSGNYTVYFETDNTGSNFGGWLQYNSVSAAQIRSNVISYAQYFNSEVGGACKNDGSTVVSELQAAWTNVKTRYDNAPANDVRTAIAAATNADENADVVTFVEKYAKVYHLRGSELASQGGDFLAKGIESNINVAYEAKKDNYYVIVIAAIATISAAGLFLVIRRRKEVK